MLRSILAQLEFTHLVKQYDESGVPFRTHLHVPEVHPDTNTVFLEREDEGHVLKVRHIMLLDHAVMVDAHLSSSYRVSFGRGGGQDNYLLSSILLLSHLTLLKSCTE